jgi:Na+:H+ antiporter, NhaA family
MSDTHEFPPPLQLPGEPALPAEPYLRPAPGEPPGGEGDGSGLAATAAQVTARLEAVEPVAARYAPDGRRLLSPPLAIARDHIAGPVDAPATLLVFGAFGTPAGRTLGQLIDGVRARHPATVRVAWRHYPDPGAHPHAVVLALAAEAAAARGHFWALTRELLRLRHSDPVDLHAALVRAGLDPDRTLEAMNAGTGADRIADDVASATASGVVFTPALFVDGERYEGPLEAAAVGDALVNGGAP